MTEIAIGNTHTDVRGGGYGGGAWIAKITGLDPTHGLRRQFCRKDKSGLSGSGRSGTITLQVAEFCDAAIDAAMRERLGGEV